MLERIGLVVLTVCICALGVKSCNDTKTIKAYEKAISDAKEQAQADTNTLNATVSDLRINYEKEKENDQKVINNLRKSVSSGVRIKSNSSNVSKDATTRDTESTCTISGSTANALIDIAETADSNARKVNMCIDQYNEVRSVINK